MRELIGNPHLAFSYAQSKEPSESLGKWVENAETILMLYNILEDSLINLLVP